ncbi:hypothetical protein Tco_0233691 [Tanacetum coccineum]
MDCVSLVLSIIGKGCIYKYGGQRNYRCIMTHAYLVIFLTQIGVNNLSRDSNACRCTAATRGGRTGRQAGRGGGRNREQTGRGGGRTGDRGGQGGGRGNKANRGIDKVPDFATVIAQKLQDLLPTIVAQVGDRVSNQGNIESQNDNAADDSIHEDDRNANVGNSRNRCSYKDFVACKLKEFDGKGGAVAYIRWVKKMEAISGCRDNQKFNCSAGLLTVEH